MKRSKRPIKGTIPGRQDLCVPIQPDSSLPSTVTIRFPVAPEVRIRRLISRSAPRPVYKVPSVRLERSVHCESQLEVELAELFDACPGIDFFGEQGAEISYGHDDEVRRHIPDFYIEAGGRRAFVEAKFRKTVTEEDRHRTALLRRILAPLGYDYFLVTEADVRRDAYLSNARFLLRRGRGSVPERFKALLYSHLRHSRMELGEVLDGHNFPHVAALILQGALSVPMRDPFDDATPITLGHQEGMPWVWALLS